METETELVALRSDASSHGCSPELSARAGAVTEAFFAELRASHAQANLGSHSPTLPSSPSTPSRANQLRFYRDEQRCALAAAECRRFLEAHPEWFAGTGALSDTELRARVALQHFTWVDVDDLSWPRCKRRMDDSFTEAGVSEQLVLDAGRSDFVLPGGQELSFRRELDDRGASLEQNSLEVEHLLRDFERRLVESLLSCLGEAAPRILVQAVSRSMSQAGMANLERALRGGPQLVVSGGEQCLRYELSQVAPHMWEVQASLKKYDFEQFVAVSEGDADEATGEVKVIECHPRSKIVRGCTLRFDASAAQGASGPHQLQGAGLAIDVRGLIDSVELFDRAERPIAVDDLHPPCKAPSAERPWARVLGMRIFEMARCFGRRPEMSATMLLQAAARCQRCRRRRTGGAGSVDAGAGALRSRSGLADLFLPRIRYNTEDTETSIRAPLREPPV